MPSVRDSWLVIALTAKLQGFHYELSGQQTAHYYAYGPPTGKL